MVYTYIKLHLDVQILKLYEQVFQTTSGRVFLGPPGHFLKHTVTTFNTRTGILYYLLGLWSGPPSTYLNVVTVYIYIIIYSDIGLFYSLLHWRGPVGHTESGSLLWEEGGKKELHGWTNENGAFEQLYKLEVLVSTPFSGMVWYWRWTANLRAEWAKFEPYHVITCIMQLL